MVGAIKVEAGSGPALPTPEKKFEDYLIIGSKSITVKKSRDKYEGKIRMSAGSQLQQSISFKALLIIGDQSIECDVAPQRLSSKEEEIVSISIPISKIPESVDITTAKIKFNLTVKTADVDLTHLGSDELSIILEVPSKPSLLNRLLKWFGSNLLVPIAILTILALIAYLSNNKRMDRKVDEIRSEFSEKLNSLKEDITTSFSGKLEQLDITAKNQGKGGINPQIESPKGEVRQIPKEIPSLGSSEGIIAKQGSQSLTALQEMIHTYNQYSDETKEQWINNLKAMYGNQLLRVNVIGIEDMGMMNSHRQVQLKKYDYGNFIFIANTENSEEEEGYIFPVPWLRFNSTTLTDQLKPFYNLPDRASEGIIERVEQPAYVKKLADGQWEVEKGKICFKGETTPAAPKTHFEEDPIPPTTRESILQVIRSLSPEGLKELVGEKMLVVIKPQIEQIVKQELEGVTKPQIEQIVKQELEVVAKPQIAQRANQEVKNALSKAMETVLYALAQPAQANREARMNYTEAQLRQLAAARGKDWETMAEDQREIFIDDLRG